MATAADVVGFYQALLDDQTGLWDPAVLTDVTSVVRNTFPDPMLRHARPTAPAASSSPVTTAAPTSGAWVAPCPLARSGTTAPAARWPGPTPPPGLSFAYLTNGLDRNFLREHRRTTALASLAAVCAV